jgi:hypothetical protein
MFSVSAPMAQIGEDIKCFINLTIGKPSTYATCADVFAAHFSRT